MVIDTSAIVAFMLGEKGAAAIEAALVEDPRRLMSTATYLELVIVVEHKLGAEGARELDLLVYKLGVQLIAFSARQADIARLAFRKFGKGKHPAGLNFGDCFSYALAAESGEPLLFKGNDFGKTDVALVSLNNEAE